MHVCGNEVFALQQGCVSGQVTYVPCIHTTAALSTKIFETMVLDRSILEAFLKYYTSHYYSQPQHCVHVYSTWCRTNQKPRLY